MSERVYAYFLANERKNPNADLEVRSKHEGKTFARVSVPDASAIDRAIEAAVKAAPEMRDMRAFRRRRVLERVVQDLRDRYDEYAETMALEVGKPIRYARAEVDRAIDTFTLGAEEATRLTGEWLPLDVSPRGAGFQGIVRRAPLAPCSFITPFNFPLNLAAHKIAPAIAAGATFVLKPDPRTPLTALMLGEALADADLPRGAFSILPALEDGIEMFSEDERLRLLSFTGSPKVGWGLKARAGKKRVHLELGGNAACIVDEGADLDSAAEKIAIGGFHQGGQSCISVQRVLAHESLASRLKDMLLGGISEMTGGDPLDDDTVVGPLISEEHAKRVESWVREAVDAGAKALCGATRDGVFYEPTLLENPSRDAKVSREEIFGPVVVFETFSDFDEALRVVDDSRYGLQAGVFTPRLDRAFRAFDRLEVGGVVINHVPTARVDAMPYGGVKESGLGREGVRYAIEEMTERRILLLHGLD